jgi:hypothetical protein
MTEGTKDGAFMKPFKLLILMSIFLLSACSLLDHRDFSNEMDEYRYAEPMFSAHQDFMVLSGDSGRDHRTNREIKTRTPASINERYEDMHSNSLRRELKHYEARLTEDEYYEFSNMKDEIGSVSEQIYYLRLNSRERQEYLQIRKIKENSPRNSRGYDGYGPKRLAFHELPKRNVQNDVVLGMQMDEVVGNWGTPEKRDIAGDPKFKNERWAFRKNGRIKYIYFESGRVQGWSEQ